jgi:hypothetical protein
MISISAPTYEFIVHNFSGDSGAPTPVAEGAPKPEYTPAATSLADWPQWLAYVQTECFRQIMDLENSQLLSGSGTGAGDLRVPPAMCARRLPRPS